MKLLDFLRGKEEKQVYLHPEHPGYHAIEEILRRGVKEGEVLELVPKWVPIMVDSDDPSVPVLVYKSATELPPRISALEVIVKDQEVKITAYNGGENGKIRRFYEVQGSTAAQIRAEVSKMEGLELSPVPGYEFWAGSRNF